MAGKDEEGGPQFGFSLEPSLTEYECVIVMDFWASLEGMSEAEQEVAIAAFLEETDLPEPGVKGFMTSLGDFHNFVGKK